MFKGKPTKVIITGNAKEELDKLNKIVWEEISKGIAGSNHQTLLNSIKQKIELLKANPEYGIHVPKDRIPKEYIRNYDVNNLWKATKNKSAFPTDDSLFKLIYLIVMDFQEKRQTVRDWSQMVNQLSVYFGERVTKNL